MAEEKSKTPCPLCSTRILKNGENMVYCEGYKPRKDGKNWFNEGDCDFHISRKNPAFGRELNNKDIRTLLEGKGLKNAKGDELVLDLDDTEFFTSINFKQTEKKEDKNF